MRRRWALTLLLALILSVGCAPADQDNQNNQNTPDAGPDLANGEAAYARYCSLCQGQYGEGYAADNANALSNGQFLATATDAFLTTGIAEGRPGTAMPAWRERYGGPLSDADIVDLVYFLRTWQHVPVNDVSGVVVSGDASRAEPIYASECASCHGPTGGGSDVAMTIDNPYFLSTASDGFLREAIAKGRTFTAMPGFESQLSAQQIDDLVALLRSWEVPIEDRPIPTYVPTLDASVVNPTGPDPNFILRDGRYVPADDVYFALQRGERMILADARATSDYLARHITGAVSLPFYEADLYAAHLPADVWIIAYCGCPHAASGVLADALIAEGYPRVAVLDEGYFIWTARGYPTEAE